MHAAGVSSEDRNKPLVFASSFGSRGSKDNDQKNGGDRVSLKDGETRRGEFSAAVEDTRYVDLDIVSLTSLWGEMRQGWDAEGARLSSSWSCYQRAGSYRASGPGIMQHCRNAHLLHSGRVCPCERHFS